MNICLYNTEDYVRTEVDSLQKKLFTNIQIEGKTGRQLTMSLKQTKSSYVMIVRYDPHILLLSFVFLVFADF